MTQLSRIRAEIARELAAEPTKPEPPVPEGIDALLRAAARDRLPSEAVIEALIADAPPLSLPSGFEERAAARRHALITERQRSAPRLGALLRSARRAQSGTARGIADRLGIAPRVWEAIEDDESPAALLNLPPAPMARLIDGLGLSRTQLALALRTALAPASGSGTGFGYRPRQAPEEAGPATVEPPDQTERIWRWLLAFMEA